MILHLAIIETPVGPMTLAHDPAGTLWAAEFQADPARMATSLARFGMGDVATAPTPAPDPLRTAFEAYFGGALRALEALPTARFGSAVERAVWAVLRGIPPGETRSYGDVARALGGAPSGAGINARVVGAANGRNPLAIVVPCHRVIGADGSLTGYAGGLDTKRWLLRHEGWHPAQEGLF